MASVNEATRTLAHRNQQFTSFEDGWRQFLQYLADRNGADLTGPNRTREVDELLASLDDEQGAEQHGLDTLSLDEFSHRPDVAEAFRRFLKHRGLSELL